MSTLQLIGSPAEYALETILTAFEKSSRQRRSALRTVQRVLALAAERGYKETEQFTFYFRHPQTHTPPLTKKWIYGLFEYVSADEFAHLAKLTA